MRELVIVLAVVLVLRIPSFFEPFSYGDEMNRISQGDRYYRDFYRKRWNKSENQKGEDSISYGYILAEIRKSPGESNKGNRRRDEGYHSDLTYCRHILQGTLSRG